MKYLIPGGSGLIGKRISSILLDEGKEVTVLTRGEGGKREGIEFLNWNPGNPDIKSLSDAISTSDFIINLSGERIEPVRRNVSEYKILVKSSRINATNAIVRAIEKSGKKPRRLVNASAVGIYGNRGEEKLNEKSPPGKGFLAEVCTEWEEAANKASEQGVNVCVLRTGVVISSESTLIRTMARQIMRGMSARLGDGTQWTPWIHIDDIAGLFIAAANGNVNGPINAVSPEQSRNRDLSIALARALGRNRGIAAPKFILKLVLGPLAEELAFSSQMVVPEMAETLHYKFRYPNLSSAFQDIAPKLLK